MQSDAALQRQVENLCKICNGTVGLRNEKTVLFLAHYIKVPFYQNQLCIFQVNLHHEIPHLLSAAAAAGGLAAAARLRARPGAAAGGLGREPQGQAAREAAVALLEEPEQEEGHLQEEQSNKH